MLVNWGKAPSTCSCCGAEACWGFAAAPLVALVPLCARGSLVPLQLLGKGREQLPHGEKPGVDVKPWQRSHRDVSQA